MLLVDSSVVGASPGNGFIFPHSFFFLPQTSAWVAPVLLLQPQWWIDSITMIGGGFYGHRDILLVLIPFQQIHNFHFSRKCNRRLRFLAAATTTQCPKLPTECISISPSTYREKERALEIKITSSTHSVHPRRSSFVQLHNEFFAYFHFHQHDGKYSTCCYIGFGTSRRRRPTVRRRLLS